MATAKKLPNGNYRVRVYDKSTGKYKSFTAQTKREAERAAAEWLSGHQTFLSPKRRLWDKLFANILTAKAMC